jgi:crossover junction endodeoxyribonuclease RuvC
LRILGIDPGSVTAGFAVIEVNGKKIEVVASGSMKFSQKLDFLDRIPEMTSQIRKIILQYKPDEVALESLIYVKSPTALIKLAQSRGAMLAILADHFTNKIYEYSPNEVKSIVSGHGHADKESMQKFVTLTTGKEEFETHDESDAIAVALCHHFLKNNKLLSPKVPKTKNGKGGLKNALQHKIREINQ